MSTMVAVVETINVRRLRRWAVRIAVAASLIWTAWTWSGGFSELFHLLLGAGILGAVLVLLDVIWVAGVAIQLLGAGKALKLGRTPRAWLRSFERIRATRADTFDHISNDKVVWLGFYVNAFAAFGFAVLGPLTVVLALPSSTWLGLLTFLAADTMATIFRVIPQKRAMSARMGKPIFRTAREGDLEGYLIGYMAAQKEAWGDEMGADRTKLEDRFRANPGGIFIAELHGKIVGVVTTIRIPDYDPSANLSWAEITADGHCTTHDPKGKVMFGVDMSATEDAPAGIHDDLLIQCTIQVMREGLTMGVLGGRMPGYHRYADQMSAEEYLWTRRADGKFLDHQVRMYASFPGLRVEGLLPDYFDDPESMNNGVLLVWKNPIEKWPFKRLLARVAAMLIGLEVIVERWKKQFRKKSRA